MAEENKETKKESEKQEKTHERAGLYRSEANKVIAGVAGGLAEYFNIDATIIRIIFILLTVFGGSGVIIYAVLWLIIPSRSHSDRDPKDTIRSNIDDMKSATKSFAHSIRNPGKNGDDSRFWIAIVVIVLGFLFLMNNYELLDLDFEKLWPLALIIFGLAILLRKK